MTHRHEWWLAGCRHIQGIRAECDCGATMSLEDAERRLNATEALSAEDAILAAQKLGYGINWTEVPAAKPLRDYARILEGSDE